MKVLFIINNMFGKGNGLCSSARTTVKYLLQAGVEVRVMSMENPNRKGYQPEYVLKKFHFPIFQPFIEKMTFCFARYDAKLTREALEWADVVHLEEPFTIQWRAARMAKKMGVPCVSTYHLHPENILSHLFLGWSRGANAILLKAAQALIFDKCTDVQCPTRNVLERAQDFNFKARLHLIPNGMRFESPIDVHEPQTDPYLIFSIGRLSVEKDQKTLLRAMRHSRYSERIKLVFAGKGPKEKALRKQAEKLVSEGILKYQPEFMFLSPEEMKAYSSKAYLYIHCAPVEVEGLSCIESLREGTVPVIAEARLSATAQFALDSRSTFPARDCKALAERIDWWIEHPQERLEMGQEYAQSVLKYDIHKSIEQLIAMYSSAVDSARKS
ncbi:MAG: glycosyltransferase [Bacteroidales bacterium]|nr:glycosyltransferase [Bacteroidales bacterium]